jgi:hypothetical protein
MPYAMETHFDQFLEKVTVSGDLKKDANARRDRISELLGSKFEILDIFPTGSLMRGTGLKGSSDVDVMLVLHYGKHIKEKTPVQVLEMVREALSEYNAQIVKKNGQAVTLYFKSWPNVDIVPTKRVTSGISYILQIPDSNTGRWITTDPKAHDGAMSRIPNRCRQLVRMVKCWNQAHSDYFQSFHIEQVALQTTSTHDGPVWEQSAWPWAIHMFFEKAIELTGPSTTISAAYELEEWKQIRARLDRAKQLSLDAWYAIHTKNDVEKAVARYRILFGDKFPAYG